jgi:hypothetical protein
MKDAYDVLTQNTDSGEAQYVAAELAVELSGMSGFLLDVASGEAELPTAGDSADLDAYIADAGIDPDYLIAAAHNLQNAQALGEELQPIDYLMGGLGLVLLSFRMPWIL